MAAYEVRTIRDDEFPAFVEVQRTAMLMPPASEEALGSRRELYADHRNLGAIDGGRVVGSTRTFATRLTVPGNASVPAGAVSSVGVLPTHRRRGHLTRLMNAQLADAAERGEALTILISAEWPIYGRYGYGMASEACTVRLDTSTAEFRADPTGSVELVDAKAFRDAQADVYARAAARIPGHITWADVWYDVMAGLHEIHDGEDDKRRDARRVVWSDDADVVQGTLAYTVTESWPGNRPRATLDVLLFTAATDEAERELYRYLAAVDWVSEAVVGPRPVDDPLPFHLVDGRSARFDDVYDSLWARVLDVPAALGARRYATTGSLVVAVVDPLGHADGRWLLDAGPDGATCAATDRAADLTVPVAALSAAYLGGHTWARLASGGLVDEERPGAVARASALFATDRKPFLATGF
jgi:predicted acetyltransferase